ncbi:hypothetical protein KAR91_39525 [Candidatus Pacearchaeota archaeon]|nr:hypothetical protein [Candidatus Pacearchaeota archaeon]
MTEPVYNKIFRHWFIFACFFAIIVLGSFQDVFDFVMLRGSGFWSIDPDIDLDAWHLFKQFKLFAIWAGMVYKRGFNKWQLVTSLCLFEIIAFFPHEWILHQLF